MGIPSSTKIVYLDQKGWIDLAKIYYGKSLDTEKIVLEQIVQASDSGTAIFPISIVNFSETATISKNRWRKELASLIVKVSKYYTILPYIDYTIDLEAENLILKILDSSPINIRERYVGKGFARLMGAKPEATSEKIDKKILAKINQKASEELDKPETLEYLMSIQYKNDEEKRRTIEAIKTQERIREKIKDIKDNDLRRKAFMLQNFQATVMPIIARKLYEIQAPRIFMERMFENFNIDIFLENFPTALCFFTLLFQRDQQYQRAIQFNDMEDIWHLTLAIPYCDIVVTENMWTSIAKQSKLDKKCNTTILSSINELDKYPKLHY
jgi:hypothetical protein